MLPGGEDRRRLRDVQMVRRRHVDHVDVLVGEDVVERRVRVPDAQRLRPGGAALGTAAEDAAYVDTDPAERLDVDGPDEPGADDGGTDVGERAHPPPGRGDGPADRNV